MYHSLLCSLTTATLTILICVLHAPGVPSLYLPFHMLFPFLSAKCPYAWSFKSLLTHCYTGEAFPEFPVHERAIPLSIILLFFYPFPLLCFSLLYVSTSHVTFCLDYSPLACERHKSNSEDDWLDLGRQDGGKSVERQCHCAGGVLCSRRHSILPVSWASFEDAPAV